MENKNCEHCFAPYMNDLRKITYQGMDFCNIDCFINSKHCAKIEQIAEIETEREDLNKELEELEEKHEGLIEEIENLIKKYKI